MMAKAVDKSVPKAFEERLDFVGLTNEEKDAIRERAKAQVAKEQRARAEERFFEETLTEERRKHLPEQQWTEVLIDLPGHAAHILIDGVEFLHAFTYRVTEGQAATIREIIQRAWDHEDEVGGANRNFYQKPSGRMLTPAGLRQAQHGINTRRSMRGVA